MTQDGQESEEPSFSSNRLIGEVLKRFPRLRNEAQQLAGVK